MIVVPIARDRCFSYRKFLLTLGRVSHVAIVLRWVLAALCGLLYPGGRIARPLEELLNPLN